MAIFQKNNTCLKVKSGRTKNPDGNHFGVWLISVIVMLALFLSSFQSMAEGSQAAQRTLVSADAMALPGGRVQIKLSTSGTGALKKPVSFTTNNPARIALDFSGMASKLPRKQDVGVGVASSINAIEARGRTRIVLNLTKIVPYEARIEDDDVYLILESDASVFAAQAPPVKKTSLTSNTPVVLGSEVEVLSIKKIDFRRGEKGEGRVIVKLSESSVPVDIKEERGKVMINFIKARLPAALEQRLDVMDFATPVVMVDTFQKGENVQMVVSTEGLYEHVTYQLDNRLTIEIKPIVKDEQDARRKREVGGYVGDRLTLNFQDIEVRAVLQLIADFTDLNMVTSDSVKGNVTLRLKNVPWDQALDIVLLTKGLDMRKTGNVIMVAPSAEIAAREKQEFASQQQLEELAPLFTDYVQVNYAKAEEIAALMKQDGNNLLSERGSVSIDERTNTLLVQDTTEKLEELKALVETLDRPVRQVLIESRVVIANDDFSKDLGSRFGITDLSNASIDGQGGRGATAGTLSGTDTLLKNDNLTSTAIDPLTTVTAIGSTDRLNVNLPVIGEAGKIAFALLGSDYMLDLELSAMQSEGRGEVVSSPRVITSNQSEALIEQGVEVPYQQVSSSGATNVAFKKAVLSLSVTPQITPDDNVIMDLSVNKDSVGSVVLGVPSINTRKVATQVLVGNGETVVLGGIYEQVRSDDIAKVPFFGDIPVLGNLFRRSTTVDNKAELLIFVTPKILKQGVSMVSSDLVGSR